MWQDAVAAEKDGELERALQTLRDLQNRGYGPRVVSRSIINKKRAALRVPLSKKLEKEINVQLAQLLNISGNVRDAEKILDQLDIIHEQVQATEDYSSHLRERVDNLRKAVRAWSSILAYEDADQLQAALQALHQFENNLSNYGRVIPPKMVEQKMVAP